MRDEKLREIRALIGKTVADIYELKSVDEEDNSFVMVFEDGTELEVYDFRNTSEGMGFVVW